MLDPRLADVLPAASNLIRFARWFRLADLGEPDDAGIVRHVFGGGATAPLPQRTRLERAIVAHLADGGHWHRALGWCALAGL